ncbi:glutaredoxin domain-containing protein [Terrihabitans sp. B22-R8]|uniref:glutaredoxin domain-containing protein n=1 Tax=Terrihabitans sp. B22-R8 TaxID=3425128 RepID=UPI00403C381C
MTDNSATKIYLKKSCPFCLKLRIFLTEAGIADRFDYVEFEDGDATHTALRQQMEEAGQEPSFPAAELEPGKLTPGTDDLIARFAKDTGVDPATLPLLAYYSDGVFKHTIAMFRELRELKAGQA